MKRKKLNFFNLTQLNQTVILLDLNIKCFLQVLSYLHFINFFFKFDYIYDLFKKRLCVKAFPFFFFRSIESIFFLKTNTLTFSISLTDNYILNLKLITYNYKLFFYIFFLLCTLN